MRDQHFHSSFAPCSIFSLLRVLGSGWNWLSLPLHDLRRLPLDLIEPSVPVPPSCEASSERHPDRPRPEQRHLPPDPSPHGRDRPDALGELIQAFSMHSSRVVPEELTSSLANGDSPQERIPSNYRRSTLVDHVKSYVTPPCPWKTKCPKPLSITRICLGQDHILSSFTARPQDPGP
jgi:hypothetical protein